MARLHVLISLLVSLIPIAPSTHLRRHESSHLYKKRSATSLANVTKGVWTPEDAGASDPKCNIQERICQISKHEWPETTTMIQAILKKNKMDQYQPKVLLDAYNWYKQDKTGWYIRAKWMTASDEFYSATILNFVDSNKTSKLENFEPIYNPCDKDCLDKKGCEFCSGRHFCECEKKKSPPPAPINSTSECEQCLKNHPCRHCRRQLHCKCVVDNPPTKKPKPKPVSKCSGKCEFRQEESYLYCPSQGLVMYPPLNNLFIPEVSKFVKRALRPWGREVEVLGATYAKCELKGRNQTRWYLTYTAQDWMNPGPAVGTCTVQVLETQGQTALRISEKPKCAYQPGYHKKDFKY